MEKVSTVLMTMRVDPQLKAQAEKLCAEMGLTMSAACTIFLKTLVRTQSIPFKITAKKDLERGKAVESHNLTEVDND